MAAEDVSMRFLGGVAPPDVAWRMLATMAGSWRLLGYSMFSVIEKASGEWIGRLGPWRPGGTEGGWPGYEVGWGLRQQARGRGYATEGAEAAMAWAFDTLGWDHIIHCIDAENTSSIAVATRLGSTLQQVGVVLPPPNTHVRVDLYGQSREDWRARQSR